MRVSMWARKESACDTQSKPDLALPFGCTGEGMRRGSLRSSASSTTAPDPVGTILSSRVAQQEESARVLQESAREQLTFHTKQHAAGTAAAVKLRGVAAHEPHAPLADALDALGVALEAIEAAREALLLRRAEARIAAPLCAMRERLLTPMKRLMVDRKARLKAMHAADLDFSAAAAASQHLQPAGGNGGEKKDAAAAAKASAAAAERFRRLIDEQEAARHVEQLLDTKVAAFEAARVRSTKSLLIEMVRSRMAFHCRALELLTPAAAALESTGDDTPFEGGADGGEAQAVAALEKQLAFLRVGA